MHQESYVQRRLRERSSSKPSAPSASAPQFPGFSREQLSWLIQEFPHLPYSSAQFPSLEGYWQRQGFAMMVDRLCELQDAFERERRDETPVSPVDNPDAERVR